MARQQEVADREHRLPRGEFAPDLLLTLDAKVASDLVEWPALYAMADLNKFGTGRGIKIGIADTGIQADHPSFGNRVRAAMDFTGSRSGSADVNGHGTHCAGIAAGAPGAPPGPGAATDADIFMAKVLGDSGSGGGNGIAAGLRWLAARGCDVVSCSFGSDGPDPLVNQAVQELVDAGIIVVVAAGNAGPMDETVGWPGNMPGVICCAAADASGQTANFSSRGAEVDYAYLGVNVLSAAPGNRKAIMSGTSMATPGLAGVVACVLEAKRKAGQPVKLGDVRQLLALACGPMRPGETPHRQGNGIPTQWGVLGTPTPPPPPPPPVGWPRFIHTAATLTVDGVNRTYIGELTAEFTPAPR